MKFPVYRKQTQAASCRHIRVDALLIPEQNIKKLHMSKKTTIF